MNNKFEIYVYEDMDYDDFVSSQREKFRLHGLAVKIESHFFEINFYTKDIINRFNTEGHPFYGRPNLVIVEEITIKELEKAIIYLFENGYFKHLKKYRSFEEIIFYPSGEYKGKLLSSIIPD
jgi:hypothetical protein